MTRKIQIGIVIILTIILGILIYLIVRQPESNLRDGRMEGQQLPEMLQEENVDKATSAEDVDAGENVTEERIDLSKYTSNVTINKAGN